jgi:hypothetical protein
MGEVLPELLRNTVKANGLGRFTIGGQSWMCRKTKAPQTQLSRETLVRTALPRSLLSHRLVSTRVGRNSFNVLHANQLQIKEPVSLESENRESPVL